MKIWYQLISAETGMSRFLDSVCGLCKASARDGTTVEVRGTRRGAFGDQYRVLWHFDLREILENGLRIRQEGGYDAFVLANSLDPALVELREVLDIPVVSFMESCCFTACTMGERFSLVVPHERMIPRYHEIVRGYGIETRLASCESIGFAPGADAMFGDTAIGDRYVEALETAARSARQAGAEVLVVAASPAALLAERQVFELAGIPVLNSYVLLVKAAEMMIEMHRLSGTCISRARLYQSPPPELMRRSAEQRGLPLLEPPA